MTAQNRTQPKPGPAPTINIGKPQTFTLPNGLQVLVVENHKLPRVSYTLTLDNMPYVEGEKKGVSSLTSSMIGNGTTSIAKEAFNEEIDFLGAEISFYNSGASGSGLSKYAGRILELLADGALHPTFTQADFEQEKKQITREFKSRREKCTGSGTKSRKHFGLRTNSSVGWILGWNQHQPSKFGGYYS